jgi:hypothetical protein
VTAPAPATWKGYCAGCARYDTEVQPRAAHGERPLCDSCAARPPRPITTARLDVAPERPAASQNGTAAAADWLTGEPMDPAAVAAEPLPTLPGFPFVHAGTAAVISGPTGAGRSSLLQACSYDAAWAGLRVAYLGSEVTPPEFHARAADLAHRRGDAINDELRANCARVRYLNLASVIVEAWAQPTRWVTAIAEHFDVVGIDPLSSVAAALNLDFDKSNAEFVKFYDRLVQPLAARNVGVVLLENIGHDVDARGRPKGVSAKSDRADLTFACALQARPTGLLVTAKKVRSVRATFTRGDQWRFTRDDHRITPLARDDHPPDDTTFRPTFLMERTSEAITAHPDLTSRAVREAVRGNNDAKALALDLLITEGYVERRPDGAAIRHRTIRPYTEETDDRAQRAQSVPNRAPGTPVPNVPTVPTPLRAQGTGAHPTGTPPNPQTVPNPRSAIYGPPDDNDGTR